MNTRSKRIVEFLESDFFRLNNLIRKNGIENAMEKFLEEMPKTFKKATEHYEINAYVDWKSEFSVAYSGWDLMGGPDVDRYILNGRECHTTWNRKAQLEKVSHPDFYEQYKYTASIENKNLKINLYTK